MAARDLAPQLPVPRSGDVESRSATGHGGSPGHASTRILVVALLDGRPDDGAVLDAALAECGRPGRALRLVHLYGEMDAAPTPLASVFAREYLSGALGVASVVPGVRVDAVCLPWSAPRRLRRELAGATVLVTSPTRAGELRGDTRRTGDAGLRCRILTAAGAAAAPASLPRAYHLALLRELAREPERRDGARAPQDLDDAWRVGVACPALSADAVDAWAACAAWPPRTWPNA
jgi:hypothetical protein